MIKKEPVNQEPLTIEELKTMAGLQVGGQAVLGRQ